jgi:hypothetical protein
MLKLSGDGKKVSGPCWKAAHECGHGAFSDNKTIQDTVGRA